jgi:GTP-binding protein
MLDDELIEEMKAELPDNIQTVFISSVAQKGLNPLKDAIWNSLNA